MTKDEIKERVFEVMILKKGDEGNTLCFEVYNDFLGKFVIFNCLYNTDPFYFPHAKNHLNGCCTLSLDDGEGTFSAILTIDFFNSKKGCVILRC